jgi:hypothetical protein
MLVGIVIRGLDLYQSENSRLLTKIIGGYG